MSIKDLLMANSRGAGLQKPAESMESPVLPPPDTQKPESAMVPTPGYERNTRSFGGVSFDETLGHAYKSIENQLALASSADPVTMREVEIRKAQSSSVIDAIEKGLEIASLQELVKEDQYKFKRGSELAVLNPMLLTLQTASMGSHITMSFLVKQIHLELESDTPNLERVSALQFAYDKCIETMDRTIKVLDKTIQLERKSGGRPWGDDKESRRGPRSVHDIMALDPTIGTKPRVNISDMFKGITKDAQANTTRDPATFGKAEGMQAKESDKPVRKLTRIDMKRLLDGNLQLQVKDQDEAGKHEEISLGIDGSALDFGLDVEIDSPPDVGSVDFDDESESEELGLGLGFDSNKILG